MQEVMYLSIWPRNQTKIYLYAQRLEELEDQWSCEFKQKKDGRGEARWDGSLEHKHTGQLQKASGHWRRAATPQGLMGTGKLGGPNKAGASEQSICSLGRILQYPGDKQEI